MKITRLNYEIKTKYSNYLFELVLFAGLAEFDPLLTVAELAGAEFVLVEFVAGELVAFKSRCGVGVAVSTRGVELLNGKFGLTPFELGLFALVFVVEVPLHAKPNAPIPASNEIAMIFFISDFSCLLLFK